MKCWVYIEDVKDKFTDGRVKLFSSSNLKNDPDFVSCTTVIAVYEILSAFEEIYSGTIKQCTEYVEAGTQWGMRNPEAIVLFSIRSYVQGKRFLASPKIVTEVTWCYVKRSGTCPVLNIVMDLGNGGGSHLASSQDVQLHTERLFTGLPVGIRGE